MDTTKIYADIDSCRLCYSKNLNPVLDLKTQPPANSLRKDLSEKLPEAPLKLVQCSACSAVQLTSTVDPTYLFSHYIWVTGTSATARTYSDLFATEVLKRSPSKNPFVVEIASNDGTFLKRFKEKGCNILGVDPAKNIATKATSEGVPTIAEFFNSEIAARIIKENSQPNVVIARNVIPHVKEIHSIAEGFSKLINNSGLVVIEFHYAESILKEIHYDSVYHEHLFYFSIKSLSALFAKYGLHPFDFFKSPISGGSLVLFFSKELKAPTAEFKKLLESEERLGLNLLNAWEEFGKESIRHATELKKTVSEYTKKGKLVGYGASARSSTMLNFAGISNSDLDFVIDKNPLKQGLYTPGTNIKILSYEEGLKNLKNSNVLLLAWNFEEEVVKDLRASGFEGDIIVPLPNKIRIRKPVEK